MQRVSSRIRIDIITSRYHQSNSNKPLLYLVSKSLMLNSDQLSKLMETNSVTSNIYHSLKIQNALSMSLTSHIVELNQLILSLGLTSLDHLKLLLWWKRLEIKSREAELDLENSYKITILLEKELLKLLNLELHCMLKNFNWPLKSTRSLKITTETPLIQLKSDTLTSMRKLREYSLKRTWRRLQLRHWVHIVLHLFWLHPRCWLNVKKMNLSVAWRELELMWDTEDYWSSHSSRIKTRATVALCLTLDSGLFSTIKSYG